MIAKLVPIRTVAPGTITTVAEAKAHCRVDHSDDDAVLAAMIGAAEVRLDGYEGLIGRALLEQTWREDFCRFDREMRLSVQSVRSITSIAYYDAADEQATLPDSGYRLYTDELGSFVEFGSGYSHPGVSNRRDAVSVTYVCGYGDEASDVPAPIRLAILELVAHWYANREATGEIPASVTELIFPYRTIFV